MANPFLIKSGLVALSVGCVGAGGIGIYKLKNFDSGEVTSSISDLFKQSQNKVLLTQSSTSKEWNRAWVKYRDANKNKTEDAWGVAGFSNKTSEPNVFQEFKATCEGKYSMKIKGVEDIDYQRVSDWCTRPKKISELLDSEEGIELIPENQADEDWKSSWGSYREAHKESSGTGYKSTDTWAITNWNQDKSNEALSSHFKSKCLEQSKKDIVDGREDVLYKQVKSWCTRAKRI